MLKRNLLRAKMVEAGYTQSELCRQIGMSETTFWRKMRSGVFGSDEVEKLIEALHITNPMEVFFGKNVT